MNAQNEQSDSIQRPKEFFDDSSFKTLYGGVVVTWVATSAIADVWVNFDPKMLGFIVAIIVAFVGFFLGEKRNMKKFVITPFNGLLIYLTIMGGTSFLPPPIANGTPAGSSDTTQTVGAEPAEDHPVRPSTFFTSWNPDKNLLEKTNKLQQENVQLETRTKQLEQVNQAYETKLDSTKQVIRTLQISPEVRDNLIRGLDVGRNMQLMNDGRNQ